jgi:type I restriction enzyme M protein
MPEKEYKPTEDVLKRGEEQGILQVSEGRVKYLFVGKSYKITDPEEQVRAAFYLELINKYQYPKERIDLEVSVKGEKRPAADIVVYEDDDRKKPYIVVECKKDGISQAEIKQAIEEGIPNAHYLKSKYAIVVAGNVRIAFDVANFPPQEREKNVIADIPVRYGKVVKYVYKKGGPKDKDDPSKELKDVNRDEILAKFQQCHDALWEGGKRNPAEAFDEMSKLMYCKIQDERFLTQKGEFYRFQVGTYETIDEVAERVKKIYKDAQETAPKVFVEPIKTDNPIIYTVAEILQGISLARTDLDVKGEGYEHFLGSVFRGAMGQYFTPRPIVSFMVNFLEPTTNDVVIDPACGSGGFLIYALEKVRKDLYDKLDGKDAGDRWKEFALKQVYGIEINSQLARVSMMNMIIHEDGSTNIENGDALDNLETWKRQEIREYYNKKFTLLLTNPPFGASIKEREKSYLANYELGGKIKKRNRQNTEILFIERCIDFLKPGGRMGIVLPDGILTNSSLQYVRDFITKRVQILGVVSLPQTAFRKPSSKGRGDTGSGVKASLLFLRKKKEGEKLPDNYPIFMSIAEHIGYDATGRPDKDEFPDVLKAWQEFRKANKVDFFVNAPLCFAIGRGEIQHRLDPFYLRNISYIKDSKTKYTSVPLGDLLKEKPQYGANEIAVDGDSEKDIRYIRITDIDEFGNLKNDEWKTAKTIEEKYLLKENDILFARSGATAGKTFLYRKEFGKAIFAGYLIRFEINEEKVNPLFLYYYTQLKKYSMWVKSIQRPSGQPNINSEEFKTFEIPIPPREVQGKITNLMDEAYKQKKEKEQEAEKLLNSIDDYVLSELGIKLSQIKEEKNFSVTFDRISGKRFDPFHYLDFGILKTIDKGVYPAKKLIEITKLIESGQRPKGGVRHIKEGVISIGGEHINRVGEFNLSQPRYVPGSFFNTLTKGKIQVEDVLVVKDGATTGKTAIVAEGFPYENACVNEHVFRIVAKDDIVSIYLFAILFSTICQRQINRVISGAAQKGIVLETISEVVIPVPPLSVQQKIAQEVKSRLEKAKKLKEGAKELLEKAKGKVEKLIEGKNSV